MFSGNIIMEIMPANHFRPSLGKVSTYIQRHAMKNAHGQKMESRSGKTPVADSEVHPMDYHGHETACSIYLDLMFNIEKVQITIHQSKFNIIHKS